MGDVFDRLAARAAGSSPALAVRRASRFEPVRGRDAPAQGFAGVVPLELERLDDAPPGARAPVSPSSDRAPTATDVAPAVRGRAATRSSRALPGPEPGADPSDAEDVVGARPRTARPPARPAAVTPASAGEPVAPRPATFRGAARPEQPAPDVDRPAVAADAPPVRPTAAAPRLRSTPDGSSDPVETSSNGPHRLVEATEPGRDDARATPWPDSVRTVPAARLLDQLVPALLDAHALTRREAERLVVVPTTSPRRARPDGRGQVRLDDVRVGADEIHVHVDRIEVSREPAPAPAPARPPAPSPAVDHAAYLARQDRRWAR